MDSRQIFVSVSFTVFALVAVACGSDSSSETSTQAGEDAAAPDAETTAANDASTADAANARHDSGSSDASDGATAIVPTHVASGQFHSCALMSNGDVYCWGGNQAGQLGIAADAIAHPAPLKIASLANVVEIAAGGSLPAA